MNNNFRKASRNLLLLLIGSALLGMGCLYLSYSLYISNKTERIMQSKNIIAINNIDEVNATTIEINTLKSFSLFTFKIQEYFYTETFNISIVAFILCLIICIVNIILWNYIRKLE